MKNVGDGRGMRQDYNISESLQMCKNGEPTRKVNID